MSTSVPLVLELTNVVATPNGSSVLMEYPGPGPNAVVDVLYELTPHPPAPGASWRAHDRG